MYFTVEALSKRITLPVNEYQALRHQVFTRDTWRCRVTGCERRSNLHAHHLKFRSHQGGDTLSNMLTVCNTCHDAIHGKPAKRGQALVILPFVEDGEYEASGPLRYRFVNGWKPRQIQ